ncbi:LysM peptidoglycan-binding domain-containing protein [Chloroflexota bacterium]
MLRLGIFWSPEQPLPAPPPTVSPVPSSVPDHGNGTSAEVQAVAPTFTPFPSRTPTASATAGEPPQPLATIPVAGGVSTAESTSALDTPTSVPTPSALLGPTSETQAITHTVQSGETLSSIAKQYDVSIQAIVEANDLDNADVIDIGQILTILVLTPSPPGTSTPPP